MILEDLVVATAVSSVVQMVKLANSYLNISKAGEHIVQQSARAHQDKQQYVLEVFVTIAKLITVEVACLLESTGRNFDICLYIYS